MCLDVTATRATFSGSTKCVNTVVKFSPPTPVCSMNVKPTGVTTTLMSPAPAFPIMRVVPACVSMESKTISKTVPASFPTLACSREGRPSFQRAVVPCPHSHLITLSLKQGSIDTGRRGCGRLSLNKHGLEREQQQSKEKLYVSSWTDVPCARCQGITDRNQVISLTLHGLSLQRPPATVRNANSAPHLPRQPSLFLPEKAKKSP